MSDSPKEEIEVDDLIGDIEKNIKKNFHQNEVKNNPPNDIKVNEQSSKDNQQDEDKNVNNHECINHENINNNEEKVEVEDRGVNTDELPPEELQKLVENNQELIEANEEEYPKEFQEEKIRLKKELTEELNKKNEICELLIKSNNELKNKIDMSNKKYNEIIQKIEEKKHDNVEQKITLQIQ